MRRECTIVAVENGYMMKRDVDKIYVYQTVEDMLKATALYLRHDAVLPEIDFSAIPGVNNNTSTGLNPPVVRTAEPKYGTSLGGTHAHQGAMKGE